jgi:hypothetical protein
VGENKSIKLLKCKKCMDKIRLGAMDSTLEKQGRVQDRQMPKVAKWRRNHTGKTFHLRFASGISVYLVSAFTTDKSTLLCKGAAGVSNNKDALRA